VDERSKALDLGPRSKVMGLTTGHASNFSIPDLTKNQQGSLGQRKIDLD